MADENHKPIPAISKSEETQVQREKLGELALDVLSGEKGTLGGIRHGLNAVPQKRGVYIFLIILLVLGLYILNWYGSKKVADLKEERDKIERERDKYWLALTTGPLIEMKEPRQANNSSGKKRTIATREDMLAERIVGKILPIGQFPFPTKKAFIENKLFVDCVIQGPAIIWVDGTSSMLYSNLEFDTSLDSLLYVNDSPKLMGIIAFSKCKFVECDFENIAFTGNTPTIEAMRKIFKTQNIFDRPKP